MKENTYKPQIPDVMEAIFDAAYLTFDLVAAILFFVYANGNTLFVLYGILTLTLCGGDAFHLVPRIIRAVGGTSDKIKKTTWHRITGIFDYNDRILHYFDVYLEAYVPGNYDAGSNRSHRLDIGGCQNCDMSIPAE